MSATLALFDRWKALKNFTSDRQAATALGLSAGAAAQWRMGRNGSAAVIERMAKDLGEDPVITILQAFSEASRDAEDRKTLAKLAKRFGAACLALMMLAPISNSAQAATIEGLDVMRPSIHYAKCRVGLGRLRRLLAWCRAFAENSPCNLPALCPAPG